MISQTMQDALGAQVRAELASAHLYLAMSAYCSSKGLPGAAHWLRLQHAEETGHAVKFMEYLVDRGAPVALGAIEAPPAQFGTLAQVFEAVLEHEREVSAAINKIYELALAEKDYASQVFLQAFIAEQVEEEATAAAILERIRFVEERPGSLLFIDKELGKRTATPS